MRLPSWLPRALRSDVNWLRGMSWRMIGGLFVVALGFATYSIPMAMVAGDSLAASRTWADYGETFFAWFVRYLVGFGPVLLALTIADNLPLTGHARVAALAIAIVIGAQVQWPLRCLYEPGTETACADFPASPWLSWHEANGYIMATIGFATPIALVYFYRRRDARVAMKLHTAEVARADVQRRTLTADLQAMQARVEPAFLLDTLADVGACFDRDRVAGERMLDELITYLRAALPDMRATSSTLRKELALARAYLEIVRLRANGRLLVAIDVDEIAENVAAPPMMLVPLLAAAIGSIETKATMETSIRVAADVGPDRVRIAIEGDGPAVRDVAAMTVASAIRERLHALYGDRASFTAAATAGETLAAALELPREHA